MGHIDSLTKHFQRCTLHEADVYVADYTNRTGSRIGVVISENTFDDIACFHLKKHTGSNIRYVAVNFEEYPAFKSGIKNCECMFASAHDTKKPWLMLLEMKYCEAGNIETYTYKAFSQMKETLAKLVSDGIVERDSHRIYFVYSVPEHTEAIPFGAFTLSQNETLRCYEEENIHLIGNNTMLIATPSHLIEPKQTI